MPTMPNHSLPARAKIVEVGPRDGLQNESAVIPTADKLHFVQLLAEAGYEEIEVSSFVNPRRIPQLADASDLFETLLTSSPPHLLTSTRFSALVPNRKGMD